MLAQAAIVVLIAGRWRSLGGLLVAVVTLGVVAAALPTDGWWRERVPDRLRGGRRVLGGALGRVHDRRSGPHKDRHRR
jgi:hypothetical protein